MARGKSKAKEGSREGDTWIFIGQKRFSWMAAFVKNGRPVQATSRKADFCNFARKTKAGFTSLIENEIASLGVSKHNAGFLLSFQSLETMKQYFDHYFCKSAPFDFQ